MLCTHGHDGEAVAAIIDHKPTWQRTDERICVSAELLADADARTAVAKVYSFGEQCSDIGNAYHATRLDVLTIGDEQG